MDLRRVSRVNSQSPNGSPPELDFVNQKNRANYAILPRDRPNTLREISGIKDGDFNKCTLSYRQTLYLVFTRLKINPAYWHSQPCVVQPLVPRPVAPQGWIALRRGSALLSCLVGASRHSHGRRGKVPGRVATYASLQDPWRASTEPVGSLAAWSVVRSYRHFHSRELWQRAGLLAR